MNPTNYGITRYPHGFRTCAICHPGKPMQWTPATPAENEAYAWRLAKRKAWLRAQLMERPNAFPATRTAWRKELKSIMGKGDE